MVQADQASSTPQRALSPPPLSAAFLRYLLTYDPATGIFTRNVPRGSAKVGSVAGHLHKTTGYWVIRIDDVEYGAHRLAWLYVHGVWPDRELDHENLNTIDNRMGNLRPATQSQNTANRPKLAGTSSRLKGVTWNKNSGRWQTEIKHGGKRRYLGLFDTEEAAHAVYVAASVAIFGEFARAK